MYLVSLWAGYITSPGCERAWEDAAAVKQTFQMASAAYVAWPSAARGYTGAPSHCANSRQGPQMCVAPLGHGGRMRCPSLCGSADAPHNCQAFSFIRPGSDTYRGVQPEAITAASLWCGCTCTHTHTLHRLTHSYTDTVTFGIISKRSQFHQWKDVMVRDFSFFPFCVLNIYREGEIKPLRHEGDGECVWIQKSFNEHREEICFKLEQIMMETSDMGMSFMLAYLRISSSKLNLREGFFSVKRSFWDKWQINRYDWDQKVLLRFIILFTVKPAWLIKSSVPPRWNRNTSLWAVGLLFITSRDIPHHAICN